jgi:hypothetical protein
MLGAIVVLVKVEALHPAYPDIFPNPEAVRASAILKASPPGRE